MTPKQERNINMHDYFHDLMAYNNLSREEALSTAAHEYGVKLETASRAIRKVAEGKRKKKKINEVKRDTSDGLRMIVIPDTQCKAGGLINHIEAAARYIVAQKPDVVVVLGDFWDFESLSVFNTRKQAENLRIVDDIEAGIVAMNAFMKIINEGFSRKSLPRLVFCHGNHSMAVRLPRFIEEHPHLEGLIDDVTTPFLEKHGWEVYPFLDVVNIENIYISHYIQNPHSLKGAPLGGAITTMLKNAGHSFIQGHQQTYQYAKNFLSNGEVRIGIVAGAFYQHDEGYMSIQGNRHWRGIFMLNEVKDGGGDMCEVSMNYLLKKYSK